MLQADNQIKAACSHKYDTFFLCGTVKFKWLADMEYGKQIVIYNIHRLMEDTWGHRNIRKTGIFVQQDDKNYSYAS